MSVQAPVIVESDVHTDAYWTERVGRPVRCMFMDFTQHATEPPAANADPQAVVLVAKDMPPEDATYVWGGFNPDMDLDAFRDKLEAEWCKAYPDSG